MMFGKLNVTTVGSYLVVSLITVHLI
ncbi:hypothetical protein LINPERPRIM_LOCUS10920 [Linum perenne]